MLPALRILQGALVVLGAYFVYTIGASLVVASPSLPAPLPALEPRELSEPDAARYAVITTRNLFESSAEPLPETPVEEELEETKLRLSLVGTAPTEPKAASVAIVEDLAKRARLIVSIGETIEGTSAKVVDIAARRIVLNNKGRREALSMEDDKEPAASPSRPSRRQPPKASARRKRRGMAERAKRLRETVRRMEKERPAAPPLALDLAERFPALDLAEDEKPLSIDGVPFTDMPQILRILSYPGPKKLMVADASGNQREITLEVE